MATNKFPELINGARLYEDGNDNCLGVVDVELPTLASMTQTIDGIGLAGEIDAPVVGHFSGMEVKMNWRTPKAPAFKLLGANGASLELRAAVQNWDSGENSYAMDKVRIVMRGRAKEFELGTFKDANPSDSSTTVECTYLKYEHNGETVLEIDKYAYIANINGTDVLSEVRDALGI